MCLIFFYEILIFPFDQLYLNFNSKLFIIKKYSKLILNPHSYFIFIPYLFSLLILTFSDHFIKCYVAFIRMNHFNLNKFILKMIALYFKGLFYFFEFSNLLIINFYH